MTAITDIAKAVTTATPAPCTTGSPAQKFACGYSRVPVNTTGAANAGNAVHHNLPIVAIVAIVVFALIMAACWSRSNVSATR